MWNKVSLKDHFDARLNEVDRRFTDVVSNTALAKEASNIRFDGLNELRKMATDWAIKFADKTEVYAASKELLTKIESVEKDLAHRMEAYQKESLAKIVNLEKYVSSMKGVLWVLSGTFLFISIVVPILLKYLPVLIMRGP